jgi:hypothetical protein
MPRWITRRTVDGREAEPPRRCYDPVTIAAIPGVRTIEECLHLMLRKGERITGKLDEARIDIERDGSIVGYFEITREQPPP